MIDKSAPLVDIMSFLFVFSVVLFVTSTDGKQKTGVPEKLFSISITPHNFPIDSIMLSDDETNVSYGSRELALLISFLKEEKRLNAGEQFQITFSDRNKRTAVFYGSYKDEEPLGELFLSVVNIGDIQFIGRELKYDIEVNNKGECFQSRGNFVVGRDPYIRLGNNSSEQC